MPLHRRVLPVLALIGLPLLGAAYAHATIATPPVHASVPVFASMPAFGELMKGVKLTVYGSGDGGACHWGTLPLPGEVPFDGYVAVGSDLWNNGLGCGRFLEVSGGTDNTCPTQGGINPGTRVFVVAGHCPECTNNHIDLTTPAWNAYTSSSSCVIENATWRELPGTWNRDISVTAVNGSSQWWYSAVVRHNNSVITKVEFKSAGASAWMQTDAYAVAGRWTLASPPEPLVLPLSVRFTGASNEVIEASNVVTSFNPDAESDTGVQFGASSSPNEGSSNEGSSNEGSDTHWDRDIAITTGNSSSQWWYSAVIGYYNSPIIKVEFKSAGASVWIRADQDPAPDKWTLSPPEALVLPLSVRLTSASNEVIEASNVIKSFTANVESDTGIQFNASSPNDSNDSPSNEGSSSPSSKGSNIAVSLDSAKQGEELTGTVTSAGTPITMIAFRSAGSKAWKKAKLDPKTGHFQLSKAKKLATPISVQVKNKAGEVATLPDLITSKKPRGKFQSKPKYECPPRSRDACGKAAKAKKKVEKKRR